MSRIEHPIPPLWSPDSRCLILGSFPSVKSRQACFFYGHPQNRFWAVMAALTERPVPQSIEEKKRLILENGFALWDVIASCEITGSSDSSIRNVVPNDLQAILSGSRITRIFCNGATAHRLYRKYQEPQTHLPALCLPSTSPANAAWRLPELTERWRDTIFPAE